MKFNKFDVIEINNNEYLILNVITFKDNTYLYLINNAEELDDVSVVKVIENNGITELIPIENDEEFEYVVGKILLENKDEINEIMEEDNKSE